LRPLKLEPKAVMDEDMRQWMVTDINPTPSGFSITVVDGQGRPVFTSTYRTAEAASFAAAMIRKALENAVAVERA
jgi:hypothetical protein